MDPALPCVLVALPQITRWVHHNPNSLAHGSRRKIFAEFNSDGSSVAMCPCSLTPNHTEDRFLRFTGNRSLVLGLVDISTAFADIPFGIPLAFTSFNFDESCIFVLIPQTALESGEQTLGVQSSRLGSHLLFVVLKGKGSRSC